jgi:hypothetical protein
VNPAFSRGRRGPLLGDEGASGRGTRDKAGTAAETERRWAARRGGSRPRAQMVAVTECREPKRLHFRSPRPRRLGLIDYALLGLIALGVAITFVMAVVNR